MTGLLSLIKRYYLGLNIKYDRGLGIKYDLCSYSVLELRSANSFDKRKLTNTNIVFDTYDNVCVTKIN
jgi:hypothetical protein